DVLAALGPHGGRVPAGCGYCFGTSPKPSERGQSAGHHHAKPVFTTPSVSLDLSLSTLSPSTPRSATGILFSTVCGHGGTRYRRTSFSVHTWSVRPAAIAGVHGRHRVAEPRPFVTSGAGNGWRRLAWGKTKL